MWGPLIACLGHTVCMWQCSVYTLSFGRQTKGEAGEDGDPNKKLLSLFQKGIQIKRLELRRRHQNVENWNIVTMSWNNK